MKKTAFVTSDLYLHHFTGSFHPESPARLQAIMNLLRESKVIDALSLLAPRIAEHEELLLCHSADYISLVEHEVYKLAVDKIAMLSTGDVVISPASYEVAKQAVGGCLVAVDAVCTAQVDNAFCAVRPPGHHACSQRGMGFCLFNNVAIAARYAMRRYGFSRVLIVDWDVHHGNGTQEIFEDDPSVFYFSTHQKGIYPGTGDEDDRGAENTKLNCPIEGGKHSREAIIEAFTQKLVPAMAHFQPECVFLSAGFDAHYLDPIGGCNVTEKDFAYLTRIVMDIAQQYADNRLISVLEGGYNVKALASCVLAHILELQV